MRWRIRRKRLPVKAALGQLEHEVPSMPDEAPAGLEQPLLETREGPALDGDGQDEPTQQIAEVVGDDPEQQADLVGPIPVTGEPGPVGGFLALLDPLLGRPALVIEAEDGAIRPGQGGDDEAHPRKEFSEVMLNLGDHSSRPVPGGRLIREAPVPDQRRIAGPAAGPDEQIFDGPLQHGIGREGKGRVGAEDDGLPWSLAPVYDGEENLLSRVRTVDVARPERGGQAVALVVEDEERIRADGLDVTVIGRFLLRAVSRTFRAVDI
jgi:hypothetical protein